MIRGEHGTDGARDRGQTNIDFVVGIVVFLLAFSFVVAATPQLLAPYDDQETSVVAERVTSTLADSLLVDGGEPGTLDPTCIDVFFTSGTCPTATFDPADSPQERVGVEETYRLNVTLQWNVTGDASQEVLYYDSSDDTVGPTGDYRLVVGPPVPDSSSVASERRTVTVGDQPATLLVRMW